MDLISTEIVVAFGGCCWVWPSIRGAAGCCLLIRKMFTNASETCKNNLNCKIIELKWKPWFFVHPSQNWPLGFSGPAKPIHPHFCACSADCSRHPGDDRTVCGRRICKAPFRVENSRVQCPLRPTIDSNGPQPHRGHRPKVQVQKRRLWEQWHSLKGWILK
jgi:hypothetical protein